jgi:hypothetical protein
MLCLTLLMSGFSVGMVTHKSVVINCRQLTEVVRCDQLECDRNMAVNSIQPRNVDFSANSSGTASLNASNLVTTILKSLI